MSELPAFTPEAVEQSSSEGEPRRAVSAVSGGSVDPEPGDTEPAFVESDSHSISDINSWTFLAVDLHFVGFGARAPRAQLQVTGGPKLRSTRNPSRTQAGSSLQARPGESTRSLPQ